MDNPWNLFAYRRFDSTIVAVYDHTMEGELYVNFIVLVHTHFLLDRREFDGFIRPLELPQ